MLTATLHPSWKHGGKREGGHAPPLKSRIAAIDPGIGGMDALQDDGHRQTPAPDHPGLNLGSMLTSQLTLGN